MHNKYDLDSIEREAADIAKTHKENERRHKRFHMELNTDGTMRVPAQFVVDLIEHYNDNCLLDDADMEAAPDGAWTTTEDAVLSKAESPHKGTSVLRVKYEGITVKPTARYIEPRPVGTAKPEPKTIPGHLRNSEETLRAWRQEHGVPERWLNQVMALPDYAGVRMVGRTVTAFGHGDPDEDNVVLSKLNLDASPGTVDSICTCLWRGMDFGAVWAARPVHLTVGSFLTVGSLSDGDAIRIIYAMGPPDDSELWLHSEHYCMLEFSGPMARQRIQQALSEE